MKFSVPLHLDFLIGVTTILTEGAYNMLRFVITQSYITKLINNAKVLHWLLENEYDYHHELKRVIQINSIGDENNDDLDFTDF
ncbi:hypothetical protein [Serratia symbiotica]|uniref:Uncharacterized protein n=1 Tax=Serratia symbiotica SCt-VLC TaxID=1347341 RepID=A0A068RCI3_9GAMM|nr:hypothetical protein [Serratia symbiotica]CDG49001.1 hypothetical protein SCTVLC_2356 [Serratia symbiotica SCt-VLC]